LSCHYKVVFANLIFWKVWKTKCFFFISPLWQASDNIHC
jgi:hypothetical protein